MRRLHAAQPGNGQIAQAQHIHDAFFPGTRIPGQPGFQQRRLGQLGRAHEGAVRIGDDLPAVFLRRRHGRGRGRAVVQAGGNSGRTRGGTSLGGQPGGFRSLRLLALFRRAFGGLGGFLLRRGERFRHRLFGGGDRFRFLAGSGHLLSAGIIRTDVRLGDFPDVLMDLAPVHIQQQRAEETELEDAQERQQAVQLKKSEPCNGVWRFRH